MKFLSDVRKGFHYARRTLNTNHYYGDILSTWNTISQLYQFQPNGLNNISVDSLVWLVDVIASILLKFSKSPCGSSWMNWNLEIGDYKKFSTIVICYWMKILMLTRYSEANILTVLHYIKKTLHWYFYRLEWNFENNFQVKTVWSKILLVTNCSLVIRNFIYIKQKLKTEFKNIFEFFKTKIY